MIFCLPRKLVDFHTILFYSHESFIKFQLKILLILNFRGCRKKSFFSLILNFLRLNCDHLKYFSLPGNTSWYEMLAVFRLCCVFAAQNTAKTGFHWSDSSAAKCFYVSQKLELIFSLEMPEFLLKPFSRHVS